MLGGGGGLSTTSVNGFYVRGGGGYLCSYMLGGGGLPLLCSYMLGGGGYNYAQGGYNQCFNFLEDDSLTVDLYEQYLLV